MPVHQPPGGIREAAITDPAVIHKILAHLDKQTLLEAKNDSLMPPLRGPPATASFSDYIIQRDFDYGKRLLFVLNRCLFHATHKMVFIVYKLTKF